MLEIQSIDVRWHHGYGNLPELEVTVDELPEIDSWIYTGILIEEGKANFLISKTYWPWVRFVLIRDPEGSPNLHGACGGHYRLVDGTVYHSRTGWSSREGVVNTVFQDFIPNSILAPIVVEATKGYKWHGYYCSAEYLAEHPKFPKGVHLIRDEKYDGEISYYPSVHPDRIEKAEWVK